MALLGTYLGFRVGVYKGQVDKIMPLLEALQELREQQETYDLEEKRRTAPDEAGPLEIVEQESR